MASDKLSPVVFDDDNPEWTEDDFARARPAAEVLPPEVLAAFEKKRGRPVGTTTSDREQVSLRLPKSVIEHFKGGGPGWQTRVVDVLVREAATGRFMQKEAPPRGAPKKRA